MNLGELILYASGLAAAISGLWRLVIKPGAQAITTRETTAPVLVKLAKMTPPMDEWVERTDSRLDDLESHVRERGHG